MKIKYNVSAKEITNFKTGGMIPFLIEVQTRSDLREAIDFAQKKNIAYKIVGAGTNILMTDSELNIVVIRLVNGVINVQDNILYAESGTAWDDVVKTAVENNLQGIECMSAIPGTSGAAPVQNIGAYGQELSDVLYSVEVYDSKKRKFSIMKKKDCKFSYRDSIFKSNCDLVIYSITLKLHTDGAPNIEYGALKKVLPDRSVTLDDIRTAIIKIRAEKFGDLYGIGTAGSFFKNPILSAQHFKSLKNEFPDIQYFEMGAAYKVFGAWIIEKAGWKGYQNDNVCVSTNNPLILKNYSGLATSQQVYELANEIINDVKIKFDIELEPEVDIIGF